MERASAVTDAGKPFMDLVWFYTVNDVAWKTTPTTKTQPPEKIRMATGTQEQARRTLVLQATLRKSLILALRARRS